MVVLVDPGSVPKLGNEMGKLFESCCNEATCFANLYRSFMCPLKSKIFKNKHFHVFIMKFKSFLHNEKTETRKNIKLSF